MAQHIYKTLPKITRPAFERYGFAYAEVLSHWPLIVGPALAACSAPVRIRWPAQRREPEKQRTRRRTGGTLVICAADGRAVELQHETAQIIERVNTYYGYQAITDVKIVQGMLANNTRIAPKPPALTPQAEAALDLELDDVDDAPLRAALTRLGRGALARMRQKGH